MEGMVVKRGQHGTENATFSRANENQNEDLKK
jgi:hypothetical protein